MAHFAQSPSFILHQVTCQFATGDTLFGPLNLSLAPSLCALVGRNGSGKTRLLRLLAGCDEPASGHIERFATHAYVAQQPDITPRTTLAELLGYEAIFAARKRIDSGDYQPDDLALLDGHWDVAERIICCWTNPPTISTGRDVSGSTTSSPVIRGACWSPPTTVNCWRRYRVFLN